MAYGLISTIHRRTNQFTQQLQESEQRIQDQWELVAQCDKEIAHLCARTGNVEAPASFLPNQRRVNCVIPMVDGALVVLHFVQRRGNRQVEMVAGRAHNEAVYISDLYLTPDYSRIPTDPMGPWFLQLLMGAAARFNTLTKATHQLPDWEPYTKIMCY